MPVHRPSLSLGWLVHSDVSPPPLGRDALAIKPYLRTENKGDGMVGNGHVSVRMLLSENYYRSVELF